MGGAGTIGPYIEEARAFEAYATVGSALPVLTSGRPVYFQVDAERWATVTPRIAVGHSSLRRLIDLPAVHAVPASPDDSIADVLAHTPPRMDWLPVVHDGRLVGQVRLRHLGSGLAGLRADVAAAVGHDINNVLTVLYTCLDNLEGPPDPMAVELARHALAHGQVLARRLLDWSREGEVEPVAIELAPILQEIVPWLDRMSGEARVELVLSQSLPDVMGDRASIERIVLNLVMNAVEAARGKGRIVVRADLNGSRASVWISDDGPGIDATIRDALFDVGVSTKRGRNRLRGRGLDAVRRSAGAMGGRLVLERTGQDGTCFRLDLKLAPPLPTLTGVVETG